MQECQFSETQFSFCFTFEFIKKWFPEVPLPIFPNTYDEGQIGGGYDVMISGNIFFQFKISPNFYDKVNNFFRIHWDTIGHEYYKIKVDTNHNQFRLLKNLDTPGNNVFYAAPEFHLLNQLEEYYNKSLIERNSAIFSITDFPAAGSGHHHLIYSSGTSDGYLFSDPIKIRKVRSIHPNELVGFKEDITIFEQARTIVSKLNLEGEHFSPFDTDKSANFVKQVYSHLLVNYNVHWYPIIRRF